jgi:hypothetical protein
MPPAWQFGTLAQNYSKGPAMKLLDLLAKLGILRFGAKAGTYKSEKDRPTEFMMDDVYDAKRDLVTSEDTDAKAEPPKKSA